ncbi:hypothetical protein [Anaerohalosphaera lusitana]|nr:hypothetical protein [Anaerohalosphaera lusitana]
MKYTFEIIRLFLLSTVICGCSQEDPEQTVLQTRKESAPVERTAPTEYRIEQDQNGKYWFAYSDGSRFLSIGIDNVVPSAWNPRENTDYYNAIEEVFGGDYQAWKKDVTSILADHKFNTFGAWSDGGLTSDTMYQTPCLYVAAHKVDRCLEGLRPGFEQRVRDNIDIILADHPDTSRVIGVFLDNEAAWFGRNGWDDIATYTLLELAMDMSEEDPANLAAKEFIKSRYKSLEDFSEAWGRPLDTFADLDTDYMRRCLNEKTQADRDAFTRLAAEKYFSTATRVVREVLPGRLILGVRFAAWAPEPVMEVCGKYCDVVSINDYRKAPEPSEAMLTEYYVRGGKPLMITEFSWRAKENTSGNPNTGGAGAVVETQEQRAKNYQAYVEELLSYPMVIGAHWFEFADQSPQGRFDGENSNYGIVDIHHRPYSEVLDAMEETNGLLEGIHAKSSREVPTELIEASQVTFTPGQHPERPPAVDLLEETPIQGPELFNAPDAKTSLKKDGDVLTFEYNTGDQWGCGVIFHGPKMWALEYGPNYAVNLDGYSTLVIDAEFSQDVTFEVFVDEAGVGHHQSESFNVEAGDDGESFTFGPIPASSGRKEYRFDFEDLKARVDWGNQRGARRVDLNAMKGFAIYLIGGQGQGTIDIRSVRLVR